MSVRRSNDILVLLWTFLRTAALVISSITVILDSQFEIPSFETSLLSPLVMFVIIPLPSPHPQSATLSTLPSPCQHDHHSASHSSSVKLMCKVLCFLPVVQNHLAMGELPVSFFVNSWEVSQTLKYQMHNKWLLDDYRQFWNQSSFFLMKSPSCPCISAWVSTVNKSVI